jgi:hypothetical protein
MHSSTCFGRPHVHHQEVNNCSSGLWLERGAGSAVSRGRAGYHASTVKPEAATTVVQLLMMGLRKPETC